MIREYLKYLLPACALAVLAVARQGAADVNLDSEIQRKMTAGVALMADHKSGEAVAIFREVLAVRPDDAGAQFQLALALDRSGRVEEGFAAWQQVYEGAQARRNESLIKTVLQRFAQQGDLEKKAAEHRQNHGPSPLLP